MLTRRLASKAGSTGSIPYTFPGQTSVACHISKRANCLAEQSTTSSLAYPSRQFLMSARLRLNTCERSMHSCLNSKPSSKFTLRMAALHPASQEQEFPRCLKELPMQAPRPEELAPRQILACQCSPVIPRTSRMPPAALPRHQRRQQPQ